MRGVIFPVLVLVLVLVLVGFAALAGGCTRLRFIVDAVPASDELTETTVLRDERRGFGSGSGLKVAIIDVNGLLVDARRRDFLGAGENPVDLFTESLRRAAADTKVRAVIVRIDSAFCWSTEEPRRTAPVPRACVYGEGAVPVRDKSDFAAVRVPKRSAVVGALKRKARRGPVSDVVDPNVPSCA